MTLAFLRFGLAVFVFAFPGVALQRLLLGRRETSFGREWSGGFALSTAMLGLLGTLARSAHLSYRFILVAFGVLGILGLLALARARLLAPRAGGRGPGRDLLLSLGPALVAIGLAARLCLAPALEGDDSTHTARIRYFQSAPALGFEDFIFGTARPCPPRYWIAYWPLSKAVLGTLSGQGPLELMAIFVSPCLGILALVAGYELARALGLSRALAGFATVAQLACLLFATDADQAGGVFFNRLAEDKAMAAFVLAPIFFRVAADYLAAPARRTLLLGGATGLALVLTHPTSMGLACLITLLFAVARITATRSLRPGLAIVALTLALPLAPLTLRFAGGAAHHAQFTLSEAAAVGDLENTRMQGLLILENPRFYGIHPSLYSEFPFGLLLVASGLALRRLGQGLLGPFLVACTLVGLAASIPWTGWLLGLAITPFHLWRVLWLMPLGLACAFLARLLPWSVPATAAAAAQLALLAGALADAVFGTGKGDLISTPLPERWQTVIYSYRAGERPASPCERTFAGFARVGRYLDAAIDKSAVVAADQDTYNFVPTLSVKARPFVYRNKIETAVHGGFSREETYERFSDWLELQGPKTAVERRLAILDRYHVRFLLLCEEDVWVRRLLDEAPERVRPSMQTGQLRLYEVSPP
jgi:hypothetical protein